MSRFNTRWHLVVNNVAILGEFIADWDYAQSSIQIEVGLSLADIRASTHPGTSANLLSSSLPASAPHGCRARY